MDKTKKKKATKKGAADGNDLNGPVRWFEVNNGLHFVRIARSRIKERSDESQQPSDSSFDLCTRSKEGRKEGRTKKNYSMVSRLITWRRFLQ
jgi:hypothetical protein